MKIRVSPNEQFSLFAVVLLFIGAVSLSPRMEKLAHDLAPFITVIWGQCELFKKEHPEFAENKRLAAVCEAASEIDKVILGAVAERRERKTELPEDLLNREVRAVTALPCFESVEFELALADDLPPLPDYTPPTALHRAIVNICSNAKHAMEGWRELPLYDSSGSVPGLGTAAPKCGVVRIETRVVRTELYGDVIALTIADNGPGMSGAQLLAMVSRMNGGPEAIHDGHGHGLQIVKAFADRMGGRVDVRSVEGEGTTFTIVFPVQPMKMVGLEELLLPVVEKVA